MIAYTNLTLQRSLISLRNRIISVNSSKRMNNAWDLESQYLSGANSKGQLRRLKDRLDWQKGRRNKDSQLVEDCVQKRRNLIRMFCRVQSGLNAVSLSTRRAENFCLSGEICVCVCGLVNVVGVRGCQGKSRRAEGKRTSARFAQRPLIGYSMRPRAVARARDILRSRKHRRDSSRPQTGLELPLLLVSSSYNKACISSRNY